ncbi:MAG TPA: alpha/beta fold hydrolase [Gemmatimonadaceae bacterium]|nr:alpha/beta fold hydrolase [Gemmatimonadaceae bacterium]
MDENDSRWRKILLSGGAIVGAAAAYNAFARKGVDQLTNLIGGEEGGFDWRGHRIAFTKRGSGPAILLVHGIHAWAWSYEWHDNVEQLARHNTVYTIDLLGFGRSERPAVRYSARLYISLISDFVHQVVDAPCVLVATGLSGAYATVLAARDPQRFPAIALIAPTGLIRLNKTAGVAGEAGRLAVESPVFGTAMFNGLASRRSIRSYLEKTYSDDTIVTGDLIDIYYWTSHQRGARHAPAAFLSGNLNIDVRQALRRLTQPTLLVWGEEGSAVPVEEFRGFRAIKRDLELAVLTPAGDLPHDERPDDFNVILSTWLNRLSLSSAPTLVTLPGTPEASPPTSQL